ncbi:MULTISPECIES: nitroreductase family protein [Legionella]|uniref:nitroreductase family protein n=1 Tax=Legionella TaxID=445 RepID=UPI000965F288|nr:MULTISPECIES: nitroreductase family protein [Legionella]MBN9227237.1 nitroreductase family protein [Legionella steelei]OJW14055.1 MAG: nitroreductase [Legionella sp. 39-23]
MATSKKTKEEKPLMSEIEAIYKRRAVRNYTSHTLDKTVINSLLDAAVQAPTAMDEEPWSFVVIQDQEMLDSLSNSVKALIYTETHNYPKIQMKHLQELVNNPDFHAFYNASTLIVIYSKYHGPFVAADCWLAAENLMLTACAQGLGTCVIGLAVLALNTPEWKTKLGLPSDINAIAPIIVGIPASEPPAVPRKSPEILVWK